MQSSSFNQMNGTGNVRTGTEAEAESSPQVRHLRNLIRVLSWANGIGVLVYLSLFFWSGGVGQILAEAIFLGVGWLIVQGAGMWTDQKKYDLAGAALLGGVAIGYVGAELFWLGATPYLLFGGLLLMALVSLLALPRQWSTLLTAVGAFAAYFWLINQFTLARYNVIPLRLHLLVVLYTGATSLLILWGIMRNIRVRTLQNRLLLAFIMVAFLPVIISMAAPVFSGIAGGQESAFALLRSVVDFRQGQIDSNLQMLRFNLRLEMTEMDVAQSMNIVLSEPEEAVSHQISSGILRRHLEQMVEQSGLYDALFLVDSHQRVLVSTDPGLEQKDLSAAGYIEAGRKEVYWVPPFYSPEAGKYVFWLVYPVLSEEGQVMGEMVARISMETLNAIMAAQTGMHENQGETYLVGADGTLLTPVRDASYVVGQPITSEALTAGLVSRRNESTVSGIFQGYGPNRRVLGVYTWIDELQVLLAVEQEEPQALAGLRNMLALNFILAIGALGGAVLVALLLTRTVVRPLVYLVATVEQIAAGDLERQVPVERQDEIGALALAFNSMTTQLRGLIGTLEQRVAERTRELERRSAQLEAAARVVRDTSAIRDMRQLLMSTVRLMAERNNFYHVGIFLVDDSGEYVVLQAASSPGGQRMLSRGYRRRLGEGLVGQVARIGEARMMQNREEDSVFRLSSELPLTRSELALPLRVRERVLGVLDVHATEAGAFAHEDLAILQILADLVALAIENVHLLADAQHALQERETLYGQRLEAAWRRRLTRQQDTFLYTGLAVEPASPVLVAPLRAALPEDGHPAVIETESGRRLIAPILLRGKQVAMLALDQSAEQSPWGKEELALVEDVAGQVAVALENARLLEETRVRAAREQLVGEVAARVRTSSEVDMILRTAIRELGTVLGAAGGVIRLEVESGGEPDSIAALGLNLESDEPTPQA